MHTVLLLGNGGREHAMAWKLQQSKLLSKLYIAPGNPGTALLGENVNVNINDFEALKKLSLDKQITMLVVGPEEPLVNGVTDFFHNDPQLKHIVVIGPDKRGAQLEGSKDAAKIFMQKYGIPTAQYQTFTAENKDKGAIFLQSLEAPYVLKADGLAAGKGVLIIDDIREAQLQLDEILNGKFGAAGQKVVIEQFLKGIELSVFVLTDGKSYKILPEAKDYKRIGAGDTGPNTGGMGSVSPVSFADKSFMKKVEERVITPTIKGLQQENIKYCGFLFIGLMNVDGNPYVIEYNVRMGDPETQSVMLRLDADLLDLFDGVGAGTLNDKSCRTLLQTAVTVVCVAGGYPDNYEKGKIISGLETDTPGLIFYAGTARDKDNRVITAGGRVLAVTSTGNNIEEAREAAYKTISAIRYEGMYFRTDIGNDLIHLTSR